MQTARTSIVVSVLSIAITAIGFANQLLIARTFGASRAFDEFLQATSLPLLVAGAFGGLFAYAMIPALIRATADTEHPNRPTTAFLAAIIAMSVLVGLVGAVTAPWSLRLLTSASSAGPPDATVLAIARVAWIGTGASLLVGFGSSVLNMRSRFVLPVVLSALPYLGMVAAILVAGRRYGALALVWGLVSGTVLSALLLVIAGRGNFAFREVSRAHFEHVRIFLANAPLALIAAVTFSVYQSIDAFWAPRLGPANLSVLGYCQRMLIALGAVMAAGPSVILQPRLAAAATRGDENAFVSDLGRALRLTIMICAPAAFGISLLAHPIVRFAFERGAFTREATASVAGLLPWMLSGMVPMVCTVMLFKALYAKADTRTATLLGVAGPVLYFVGSGLLMQPLGLSGIGVTYLLTWTVLVVIGTTRVSEHGPGIIFQWSFIRELTLVLAGTALPAYAMRLTLFNRWESLPTPALALRLGIAAVVGTASYLAVALFVARVEDLRMLARGLRRA